MHLVMGSAGSGSPAIGELTFFALVLYRIPGAQHKKTREKRVYKI